MIFENIHSLEKVKFMVGQVVWTLRSQIKNCTVLKTGAETKKQKSHAHFDWVSIWGLLYKEFCVISPIDEVIKVIIWVSRH